MTDSTHRAPPRSSHYYVDGAAFKPILMGALEGQETVGNVSLKPMFVGQDMLMVEFSQPAGTRIPAHTHEDHESVVYLIRGRMQLNIADQAFTAQAGDAWIHPRGVLHSSLALEDCVAVEVKSPPRQTWGDR